MPPPPHAPASCLPPGPPFPPPARGRRPWAGLVLLPGLLPGVLVGCGERHACDTLALQPQQAHALFLESEPPGPTSAVILLASVPPARLEHGVIELTGGTELRVVQPQAWRAATGTALSAEEAEREIAQARGLTSALATVADAAEQLRAALAQAQHQAAIDRALEQRQEDAAIASDRAAERQRSREREAIRAQRDRDLDHLFEQARREDAEAAQRLQADRTQVRRRCEDAEAIEDGRDAGAARRRRSRAAGRRHRLASPGG